MPVRWPWQRREEDGTPRVARRERRPRERKVCPGCKATVAVHEGGTFYKHSPCDTRYDGTIEIPKVK